MPRVALEECCCPRMDHHSRFVPGHSEVLYKGTSSKKHSPPSWKPELFGYRPCRQLN